MEKFNRTDGTDIRVIPNLDSKPKDDKKTKKSKRKRLKDAKWKYVEVSSPVENELVPSEKEHMWYDPFYKRMNVYKCHKLKFANVLEKYIEVENGRISLDEAIKEVVKFNEDRITQKEAKSLIENNCDIKEEYRIKANPEIFKEKTAENKESITKWFDKYQNYNETITQMEIDDRENKVVFSVDEDELDGFLYDMERNGFRYEVLNERKKPKS